MYRVQWRMSSAAHVLHNVSRSFAQQLLPSEETGVALLQPHTTHPLLTRMASAVARGLHSVGMIMYVDGCGADHIERGVRLATGSSPWLQVLLPSCAWRTQRRPGLPAFEIYPFSW